MNEQPENPKETEAAKTGTPGGNDAPTTGPESGGGDASVPPSHTGPAPGGGDASDSPSPAGQPTAVGGLPHWAQRRASTSGVESTAGDDAASGAAVPRWAQSSRHRGRPPLRRWLLRLAAALLLAAAVWLNYPYVPNPFILLFRQPSADAAAVSGPGRWAMYAANPQGTSYLAAPPDLQGVMAGRLELGAESRSSPAVSGGRAYLGAQSEIAAVAADTGEILWQSTPTGPVHGVPALAAGALYAGLRDQRVVALSLADGALRWDYRGDAPFAASVAVAGGVVYAASQGGQLYALDAASGRRLWQADAGGAVAGPPIVADGRVYATTAEMLFIADARTGDRRARIRAPGSLTTPPVVSGGQVFFLSEGRLLAFDAAVRELPGRYPLELIWAQLWLWQLPVGEPPPSAGLRWRAAPPDGTGGNYLFPPAAAPDALYLGTDTGTLLALDHQGREQWRWTTPTAAAIAASCLIIGDTLLAGFADGQLYALNRHSGQPQWSLTLEAPLAAPLSYADGQLYARTAAGHLHLIR